MLEAYYKKETYGLHKQIALGGAVGDVNLKTGELTVIKPLCSTSAPVPASLTLLIGKRNEGLPSDIESWCPDLIPYTETQFGKGVRTSLDHKFIFTDAADENGTYTVRYISADATVDKFKIKFFYNEDVLDANNEVVDTRKVYCTMDDLVYEGNEYQMVHKDKRNKPVYFEPIDSTEIILGSIQRFSQGRDLNQWSFMVLTKSGNALYFAPLSVQTDKTTTMYRLLATSDAKGRGFTCTYDGERLTKVKDYKNNEIVFTYASNTVTVTCEAGNPITLQYTSAGRLTKITHNQKEFGIYYDVSFISAIRNAWKENGVGITRSRYEFSYLADSLTQCKHISYVNGITQNGVQRKLAENGTTMLPVYEESTYISYGNGFVRYAPPHAKAEIYVFDEQNDPRLSFEETENGLLVTAYRDTVTGRDCFGIEAKSSRTERVSVTRTDLPELIQYEKATEAQAYCGDVAYLPCEVGSTTTVKEWALIADSENGYTLNILSQTDVNGLLLTGKIRGDFEGKTASLCCSIGPKGALLGSLPTYEIPLKAENGEQYFAYAVWDNVTDVSGNNAITFWLSSSAAGSALLTDLSLRAVNRVSVTYDEKDRKTMERDTDTGAWARYVYGEVENFVAAATSDAPTADEPTVQQQKEEEMRRSADYLLSQTSSEPTTGASWRTTYVSYVYDDKFRKVKDKTYTETEGEPEVGPTKEEPLVTEYLYNESNEVTVTKTYWQGDTERYFSQKGDVDEFGKALSDYNEFGERVKGYAYVEGKDLVSAETYFPSAETDLSHSVSYEYDEDENLTKVQSVANAVPNANDVGYTEGTVTTMTAGTGEVAYEYGALGLSKVSIGGSTMLTCTYEDNRDQGGNLVATAIDGENRTKTVTTTSDKGLTVQTVAYDGEEEKCATSYTYDEGEKVTQIAYREGNQVATDTYEYDRYGRVVRSLVDELPYAYTYDKSGNLLTATQGGNEVPEYEYRYSPLYSRLTQIVQNGSVLQNVEYDVYGRMTKVTQGKLTTLYEYESKADADGKTMLSNRISKVTHKITKTDGTVTQNDIVYTYDKLGNIIGEVNHNGDSITYEYDELFRLKSVTKNGYDVETYTYDKAGNLIQKRNTVVGETQTLQYGYAQSGWKDRLLAVNEIGAYNGTSYVFGSYDALGRPTSFKGMAMRYNYQNLLDKIGEVEYTYDCKGRRTGKTNGTQETTYDYRDGKLVLMNIDGHVYTVTHGVSGVATFDDYDLVKNAQGDVVALVDGNGNLIAKYTYDAWGVPTVYNPDGTVNTDPTFIGNINPYRYRSYLYDVENGLYYLQTRYYDPVIGRFLTPDKIRYLDPNTLNGLNLYAYCNNNPVMYSDPTGTYGLLTALAIGLIVGAIVGAASGVKEQVDKHGWDVDSWDVRQIALSTLGGAVSGAFSAASANPILGAFLGGIGDVLEVWIVNDFNFDVETSVNVFLISVGSSLVGSMVGTAILDFKTSKIMNYSADIKGAKLAKIDGVNYKNLPSNAKRKKYSNATFSEAQDIIKSNNFFLDKAIPDKIAKGVSSNILTSFI